MFTSPTLYLLSREDIIHTLLNSLHLIYIWATSPLFLLGICDAPASSSMCTLRNYLRSPICSCYPLPSAMLPMHIHLTFPLLTTHVHSFPLCFSKFSPFLSISRADGNRWNQPKIVLVRCVLSHMFCVHRPVGLGLMKEYFENNGEKREMLLNRIIFFLFSKLFSLVIVIFLHIYTNFEAPNDDNCTFHCFGKDKLFPTQSWLFMALYKKPFENIVGKGENAGNQHFLLSQQCFPPFP